MNARNPERPVRIGVCGASGKMGRRIVSTILHDKDAKLVCAFALPDDDNLRADAGLLAGGNPSGICLQTQSAAAFADADVIIDFSSPAGCVRSATLCAQNKIAKPALVAGVTGLSPKQQNELKKAAKNIAVVFSPNMSAGVNALFALAAQAAKLLGDFDMEVMEAHHRHKKDAPSGTALQLGEILARARGGTLARRAVYDRKGKDTSRRKDDIGFAVVRGGDIVGEHRLIFAGAGEQVELTHRSISRDTYAAGAVRAAKWAAKAKAGFYDMTPVLAEVKKQ